MKKEDVATYDENSHGKILCGARFQVVEHNDDSDPEEEPPLAALTGVSTGSTAFASDVTDGSSRDESESQARTALKVEKMVPSLDNQLPHTIDFKTGYYL